MKEIDRYNPIIRPMYDLIDIKYNLKEYDHELSVELHQFVDFIVWWALNNNTVSQKMHYVSACDYFYVKGIKRPGSKDYNRFYDFFQRLSFVILDISRRVVNNKANIRSSIVTNLAIFSDKLDKRKVCVMYEINPFLMLYFNWIARNLSQNIFISIKLKRKYSYKLYLYVLRRAIEVNGVIRVSYDELGRRVGRNDGEENKAFNRYLRLAIKEINMVGYSYNYHNFAIIIDKRHDNQVTIRISNLKKQSADLERRSV
mgnify:CR=1 FL=1